MPPRKAKPVVSIRRPPLSPPASERMEQFVAGTSEYPDVRALSGSGSQASGRPSTQTSELTGPGLVQRQSGKVRRRMTVYLPPELAKRLAVHCAGEGVEMSTVVAEALEKHLEG